VVVRPQPSEQAGQGWCGAGRGVVACRKAWPLAASASRLGVLAAVWPA
jgi:hypothetical protein